MLLLDNENTGRLLAQLKRHEGANRDKDNMHVAYLCPAGKLTIGYGHNLDAHPVPGLGKGSRIAEMLATDLLARDVAAVEAALNKAIPGLPQLCRKSARAITPGRRNK